MFANTTIKFRLMSVMIMLSVIMVGSVTYGLYGFSNANKGLMSVYHDRMMPSQQLGSMLDIWYKIRENTRVAVESRNAETATALAEEIKKLVKQNEDSWEQYVMTYLTPEEAALAKTKDEQHAQYIGSMLRTLELSVTGEFEAAEKQLVIDTMPKFNALNGTITALLDLQGVIAESIYIDSQKNYDTVSVVLIAVMILGILLAIVLGSLLVRSIVAPLNEAIEIANKVAAGNLTSNITVTAPKSSMGRLLQALKEMNEQLIDLVRKVHMSADRIAVVSDEIASGSLNLSNRTEQQASNLEETTASMEEFTSTIRQNSDSARHANKLTARASEVAMKGGEVVGQVVNTMQSISESSHKVCDIISVIDDIAFQTNILALNASVEAARAGEQGRGFAVVATEVQSLARRSATAAKEIKELINNSAEKVDKGARLVDEAGTTMNDIVDAVKSVTSIMHEISSVSQEQRSSIEHVTEAVMQMDDVTQQNAALAEQAAAASETMKEQALQLIQAISVFQLSNQGRHM